MYSVSDEEEAHDLIVLACPTDAQGDYIAPELAQEQTLDNLYAFGDRLRKLHDEVLKPRGLCRCKRGAMAIRYIVKTATQALGTYEADSKEHALDLHARKFGHADYSESYAAMCEERASEGLEPLPHLLVRALGGAQKAGATQ